MQKQIPSRGRTLDSKMNKLTRLAYIAIAISLIAALFGAFSIYNSRHVQTIYVNKTVYANGTQPRTLTAYNLTVRSLTRFTPPLSLSDSPVITTAQPFGARLTDINEPLNATELSIINNAPNSYFEIAGEMYLNHTLANTVRASVQGVPAFIVNGRPSVIYLGSITCIFCGENRWAMALALSRFGNFTNLFKGYSALNDGDVPTLYWSPAHYNQSTVDLGSFYQSNYINFIAIEDTDTIYGGFSIQPISVIQQEVNASGNVAYADALSFIKQINNFQGTPYTIWGNDQVSGADAVDFGNSMPSTSSLPISSMTHEQILQQFSSPNNQFAWTEYAAADLYIAMTCGQLKNTAPICSLPAIQQIERVNGY